MVELSTVTSECLSELVLDEWSAGELSPEQQQRCATHLETCSTCRARKLALEQANATFYQSAPTFKSLKRLVQPNVAVGVDVVVDETTPQPKETPPAQPSSIREAPSDEAPERLTSRSTKPARRRMSLGWVSAPLLAACGTLAFLALREPGAPTLQDVTRGKGAPRLGYYVKRGDEVRRGEAATVVHPGDSVRFVYSVDDAYYLAIFSADAHGVGVYFPSGPTAERVSAGQDVALDFSVALDDTLGHERVTALFCPEAFEIEPVQRALSSGSPLPASVASCAHAGFELNKQAP